MALIKITSFSKAKNNGSGGGGGKGMRIATSNEDFEAMFYAAKSEAKNAFGDDSVYVEKLIANPKHIEVQILGDKYGNIITSDIAHRAISEQLH